MEEQNLIMKILDWKKEYDNIYAVHIANEFFVFRTLSRKEFTDIQNHDDWTDQDKEEAFCEVVTLYPEEYNFTKCLAGIPVVLAEKILSQSLMLNDGNAKSTLNKYRDEMGTYENQIDCLITEAFPTINLDEIRSWDMHKTLYYLSRAEYVLSKLRGLPFTNDGEQYESPEQFQEAQQAQQVQQVQAPQRQVAPQQKPKEDYYVDDVFSRDIDEFDAAASMSMPNLKQLSELQKICPEIDWAKEDSLLNGKFNFEEEAKITFSAEDTF